MTKVFQSKEAFIVGLAIVGLILSITTPVAILIATTVNPIKNILINTIIKIMIIAQPAGFIIYSTYLNHQKDKQQDIAETTPAQTIRSASQGEAKIQGTYTGQSTIEPITQEKVIYAKIVQQRRPINDNKWIVEKTTETEEKIYIQDHTGKVLVNPREAELHIEPKIYPVKRDTKTFFEHINTPLRQHVAYIIKEGDKAYAMGFLKQKDEKYYEKGSENLVLTSHNKKLILGNSEEQTYGEKRNYKLVTTLNTISSIIITVCFILL